MATRTPKSPLEIVSGDDPVTSAVAAADIDSGIDTVVGGEAEEQADMLKLKGLVEEIVARTGQRKGEVRTAVQAALAVMGEALAEGKDLHLPPMGKMKVNRVKETQRGQALIVKLVQNRKAPQTEVPDDDPLEEFEQDG